MFCQVTRDIDRYIRQEDAAQAYQDLFDKLYDKEIEKIRSEYCCRCYFTECGIIELLNGKGELIADEYEERVTSVKDWFFDKTDLIAKINVEGTISSMCERDA